MKAKLHLLGCLVISTGLLIGQIPEQSKKRPNHALRQTSFFLLGLILGSLTTRFFTAKPKAEPTPKRSKRNTDSVRSAKLSSRETRHKMNNILRKARKNRAAIPVEGDGGKEEPGHAASEGEKNDPYAVFTSPPRSKKKKPPVKEIGTSDV